MWLQKGGEWWRGGDKMVTREEMKLETSGYGGCACGKAMVSCVFRMRERREMGEFHMVLVGFLCDGNGRGSKME